MTIRNAISIATLAVVLSIAGAVCVAQDVEKVQDDTETQKRDDVPASQLASQALAIPNKVPGIEITPDKLTIPSTKRFQIVTVKAEGKVKWMVFNKHKDPVEWLILPGTKSVQLFPNYGQDDEITVYAYTAVSGDPSDPVKSVITVGRELDKKPPEGDVDNQPKDGPKDGPKDVKQSLHMTVITDESLATKNAPLATLISSRDLGLGVENRGHKYWVMEQNKDLEKIKKNGFDEYVRKVNKVPLYIIQNNSGNVLDYGPLPNTLISILQKLDGIK